MANETTSPAALAAAAAFNSTVDGLVEKQQGRAVPPATPEFNDSVKAALKGLKLDGVSFSGITVKAEDVVPPRANEDAIRFQQEQRQRDDGLLK